eukprot:jgi/Mesvir1/24219/Mv10930-RA.1
MAVAASGSDVEGAAASAAKKGDDVWELDFCSRPILDDRGKKVWELLICDPSRSFTHAEYFPNSKINSTYLKEALEKLIATGAVNKPRQIRFFRSQMQTIISRACSELGVAIVPSRRCTALMGLLQERFETVYPLEAGFQKDAPPLMALQPGPLVELPDALRGEKWAFVQLPVSQLLEEMKEVSAQRIFGCTYDISNPALKLSPDTLIPGVAVFSSRDTPLSAWTSSLEMAYIVADLNEQALVLEAGIADRYRYGSWKRNDRKADREGIAWEAAKKAAAGVHFLAIQKDPDAPTVSGLPASGELDLSWFGVAVASRFGITYCTSINSLAQAVRPRRNKVWLRDSRFAGMLIDIDCDAVDQGCTIGTADVKGITCVWAPENLLDKVAVGTYPGPATRHAYLQRQSMGPDKRLFLSHRNISNSTTSPGT